MSNILGGRPRASSDGDILDDGLCNGYFANKVDLESEVKPFHGNKSPLKKLTLATSFSSQNCLDTNDLFESDDELSSQSHNSSLTTKSHKSIFSFKSVKKAVSRRFARDPNNSTNSRFLPKSTIKKADQKLPKKIDLSKVWTPDLRNFGESYISTVNGNERHLRNSTMSTARPLITDPNVSMTVPKWKRTPGAIGIINHGNSCFMNAVLQCLSNTDSFTEYFIKDFYKGDLKNSKNGKKSVFRLSEGEVTEQLGVLLKSIWSGRYNSNISKEFKSVVGKFSNQYKGDHQHDAQEFLLWLLDRIHEDVCVYSKKKQKSHKSQALTKSDEEAASEASSVNGESFVVRLFQALHASTLTCPTCKSRSSTFDPYLCVSLPLPQHCLRHLTIVLVPCDSNGGGRASPRERLSSGPAGSQRDGGGGGSLRVALTLNQYDSIGELKVKLCSEVSEFGLKAKELILVQLRADGFGSTYSNEQPVSDIGDGESLYALEAASSSESGGSTGATGERNRGVNGGGQVAEEFDTPMAQVMVLHVEVSAGSNRSYRFGSPAMLRVRRDITWKALQKEILHKMGNAVYDGILSQKLSSVFKLRVYDGSSRRNSLSCDVEMPLYTQDVERAFETLDEDFGPLHIKLTAEWDFKTKKVIVEDSREYIEVHRSVKAQSNSPRHSKVSLDECFKLYTQEEKLIGEDAWMCPHCKQQQQGTIKTLGLWSLPDILVLHLKRFKQTGMRRSKLDTLVDFPVEGLDMSPYLARNKKGRLGSSYIENGSSPLRSDDYTYDLLGVSNHYGDMMGGHYVAVCKSPVDGVWRQYNDQTVRVLDEGESIATQEAYLLFYQRRSLGKDINHRLFTGDHWAFTLSLAPSELKEDGSSSGGSTPRGDAVPSLSHVSGTMRSRQKSASRSVSPSLRKHNTKDLPSWTASAAQRSTSSRRPLTPQPHRKPIITYPENGFSDGDDYNYDEVPSSPTRAPASPVRNDVPRRSRPVQRQASEPGPPRRKTVVSADSGKFKDPPLRQSKLDNNREEELTNHHTSGKKSDVTAATKLQVAIKDKGLSRPQAKHEPQVLSETSSSLSPQHLIHPSLLQSNSFESDAKYPRSYEYSSYSNHHTDILPPSAHESASILRVRLEDSDISERASHSLPPYVEQGTTGAAAARKRLAEHIDWERLDDSALRNVHIINKEKLGRQNSVKYKSQKSYELAQHNVIDMDSGLANLRIYSNDRFNGYHPSLDLDKSKAEDQGRWDRTSPDNLNNNNKFLHSNGSTRLDSDVEEEEEEETQEALSRPRLRSEYDKVMKSLAEKHFGPPTYKKEKYDLPTTSADLPHISKYATLGRRITDVGRTSNERPLDRDIPRSSTDYSIQYNLTNVDLPAPPSPTPPQGSAEERTFTAPEKMAYHGGLSVASSPFAYSSFSNSHHRLTGRDIRAMQAYEYAGKTSFLDDDLAKHNSKAKARTLPGYISDYGIRESKHKFRPPRGIWGSYGPRVKEPQPSSIPTPCLRESSV